ncbi:MAG: hypothetical protein M3552_19235 [Planctomycetota bacterium]|nr:hypothetical protein [Planctomycetaceae bacterium]MDQ3332751.1 hypothetical protein [Planctomycetota bacterium]
MARDDFEVDKTAFSVVPLSQADDDREYWLSKSPEERLRAMELIRRTLYGYTDPCPRLERVLEVARRERN